MVVRKGQLTTAQIDREWPHQVEIAVPPFGLGSHLNDLHAGAAEIDPGYRVRSRSAGAEHFTRFCFKAASSAEAFQHCFGGSVVGRGDVRSR